MKSYVIFFVGLVALVLVSIQVTLGGDEYEEHEYQLLKRQSGVASVEQPLYEEECGSCHFAYAPGLLPQQSWRTIMSSLEDHFGDNAELANEDQSILSQYLLDHSADLSQARRSKKLMRGVSSSTTPLRITELPYFKHEHEEIPAHVGRDNPQVGSLSHCDRCHQDAKKGYYSERMIKIPGYGRWDD